MPPVIKLQLPTWPLLGMRDWALADSGANVLNNRTILREYMLNILRHIVDSLRQTDNLQLALLATYSEFTIAFYRC